MKKKKMFESNKQIKEATYQVIKTALENGFKETSKFIEFYGKSAKFIRDSSDPETTVRKSAIKIFPDDFKWLQKECDIKHKYNGKLQVDLLNLYELYEAVAKDERLNRESRGTTTTNEDIDSLLNRLN